jgi:hypothetical protein
MARTCHPWSITWKINDQWQTDVRFLAAHFTEQKLWLLSSRVPISPFLLSLSPKGPQQHLSVINEFACWLCVACVHLSQSPLFPVAGVCGFFAISLALLMVGIQTCSFVKYMTHDGQIIWKLWSSPTIFSRTTRRQALHFSTEEGVLSGCALQISGSLNQLVKLQRCCSSISCQSWGYSQGPQKTYHV